MTFKLREEVAEEPEFDCYEEIAGEILHYCYLEYNGSECYANGSITVPKGSKVKARFCVDPKGYKVALQVWDYKNWEEIDWVEHTGGDLWCDEVEFTAKKDADIGYVLYKYESGWKQVATYGKFYLRTRTIPPKPKIVKAHLQCGGKRVDKDEEVTIEMPAECVAYVTVKNESEGSGKCAIQVWDWKNYEELKWLEFEMVSGQAPTEYTPTFTVEKDADIEIISYYYDEEEGKWRDYDRFGCFNSWTETKFAGWLCKNRKILNDSF